MPANKELFPIIDVHAHLDFPVLEEQFPFILERAKAAGLVKIINSGICLQSSKKSLELAANYPVIEASIGLYPDQTASLEEASIFLDRYSSQAWAIGECGLDYKITDDLAEKEKQKELFLIHIQTAKKANLPLIIHSRKAEKDAIDILEKENAKQVILHCFEGKKGLIQRAIANKWYLTLSANINRSDQVQFKARNTPLEQLLLETDAPFLGPNKEEVNEPANLGQSLSILAGIKSISRQEAASILMDNCRKIFKKL